MPANRGARAGGADGCLARTDRRGILPGREWCVMKSAWVEHDARSIMDRYAQQGIGHDLSLRCYSTRLMGRDRKLVLHGGGNTSVKTIMTDLMGDVIDVLCAKGSGGDRAKGTAH